MSRLNKTISDQRCYRSGQISAIPSSIVNNESGDVCKARVWKTLLLLVSAISVLLFEPLEPATAHEAVLSSVDCWFSIPDGHQAHCYQFEVPASRAGRNDGTLILPVAVLSKKAGSAHDDPIVYLTGGPGSSVGLQTDAMEEWWPYYDKVAWLQGRDLVLMDQRGAGLSRPSLACPELDKAGLHLLALSGDEPQRRTVYVEAAEACRKRLLAFGNNFDDFDTKATADDFADLMQALQLKSWNIYGVSYGTRLALMLMRDHSAGLRSVVLDSVYPPEEHAYENRRAAFDAALASASASCASHKACNDQEPNLLGAVYELIARLSANPVMVSIDISGDRRQIPLTGSLLAERIFGVLSDEDALDVLPSLITGIKSGDSKVQMDVVSNLAGSYTDSGYFDAGKYFAVDCEEEVPFTDYAQMQKDISSHSLIDNYGIVADDWYACAGWVRPGISALIKAPVISSIPSLVLQGTFDPITPVEVGRGVAKRLDHSFYIEFTQVGHKIVDQSVCGQNVVAIFLDNPNTTPSQPCMNGEPERPK